MVSANRHLQLPAPDRYDGADPCALCRGARILDSAVTMLTDSAVLVIDVICPVCDGCGRGHHTGCGDQEHAGWQHDDIDDITFDGPAPCRSCTGRRWFPAQAWTDGGDDVFTLRMPCGCATSLLAEVPAR